MRNPRPIGAVRKRRAVLMIVTAHALIRRREGGSRRRLLHMRFRWPVATFATNAHEARRRRARFEPARQAEASRVTLHAVRIDLHFLRFEHFPRVRVPGVGPAFVIVLMTAQA